MQDTRLHSLLHSNEPPESFDAPAIQSAMSDIDQRICALDLEISGLQGRVAQLQEARAALIRSRQPYKAILSPLRRLPTETLGEIFMHTVPSIRDLVRWNGFGMNQSPWVLIHVCSRWREIAISLPSLWSLIYMDQRYPLAVAEMQVQRAKTLRVHIHGRTEFGLQPISETRILEYLISHSTRWEEFSIEMRENFDVLLPTLRDQVPLLRRLSLEWNEDLYTEDPEESIDYFETATSLVELRICYPGIISFSPSLQQLTRYHVDAPWETHQQILSVSPALVEAHISVEDGPQWSDMDPKIELLHLRCLYVSWTKIVQFLHVPVLEQVTFDLSSIEDELSLGVDEFMAATSGTVRRLGLRGLPQADVAQEIMDAYPSVTELAILIYGGDDYHFDDEDSNEVDSETEEHALIPDSLISLLDLSFSFDTLPLLTHLHLVFEDELLLDYEVYAGMLGSHWTDDHHLALRVATLRMSSWDPHKPSPDVRHKFDALRRSGLDFSMDYDGHVLDRLGSWLCQATWC
ncbi:hypothetical protein FB45DRAFT_1067627 [Roridomyces roridus]|uniref:F-box domain-containing protein n=1 Tax=Roridomyces roridus TaxID=1738132 RepID=A0AAD7B285_9AGAR|nr:hypothetical protein FB45DRAFT_1067627 [Roridomyces roridus]